MQRTATCTGLVLIVVFGAVAAYGLVRYATLSGEFNADCVPIFPLAPSSTCTNLPVQMGDASSIAFLGGVVAFVGVLVTVAGRTVRPEA